MDRKPNQQILNSATKFKQQLEKAGYNIQAFYIFGSHAKGHPHQDSDIDIAVISPDFNPQKSYFSTLSILSHPINPLFEPHALHPDEFNNKYSALATEIKTHGILIT